MAAGAQACRWTCSEHAPATSCAAVAWGRHLDFRCRFGSAAALRACLSLCWSGYVDACPPMTGSVQGAVSPLSWFGGTDLVAEGPLGVSACHSGCLWSYTISLLSPMSHDINYVVVKMLVVNVTNRHDFI